MRRNQKEEKGKKKEEKKKEKEGFFRKMVKVAVKAFVIGSVYAFGEFVVRRLVFEYVSHDTVERWLNGTNKKFPVRKYHWSEWFFFPAKETKESTPEVTEI